MANLFNKIINELGGSDDSVVKDNTVKDAPKDTPKDTPKDAPKSTPKDDTSESASTPKAAPKDDSSKDAPDTSQDNEAQPTDTSKDGARKPRRMTESEVIKLLEEKGYRVSKKDEPVHDETTSAPSAPTTAPLPTPAPAPAPQYFKANDTTPKVYQNPHLGVRMMQPDGFYGDMAKSAYEFDRLYGHGAVALDPGVISWIGSLFQDVPELAEDIVRHRLRDILRKNPGLIPDVKKIAKEVTVETIPYAATFVSKLDGTEYESEKDAETAMAPYKAIGATMQSMYAIRYRERHFDGTLGRIIDPKVVINFARNYDGDLDKLCYDLWLSRSKVENASN